MFFLKFNKGGEVGLLTNLLSKILWFEFKLIAYKEVQFLSYYKVKELSVSKASKFLVWARREYLHVRWVLD